MAAKQKQDKTSRVRKLDYKSKKKAVRTHEPIPGSLRIFRKTIKHLWMNKRVFGGILLVYVLLYFLFVKGLATNFQLSETKSQLEEAVGSELGTWGMGAVLFGTLVGTAGTSAGDAGAVYQTLLFVIMSLAIVWTMRQTFESPKRLPLSRVFYDSMYPLIPYILVWLVVVLQLIPAFIGSFIYSIVVSNGIAVGLVEQLLWLTILIASIGVSVFLISSSIFATYIAALPDMGPMLALKKAKSLVKFRRFIIIRRLLFLPLVVIIVFAALFFPLVLYAPVAAEVLFVVFSLALLFITHAYMYVLYREMM